MGFAVVHRSERVGGAGGDYGIPAVMMKNWRVQAYCGYASDYRTLKLFARI